MTIEFKNNILEIKAENETEIAILQEFAIRKGNLNSLQQRISVAAQERAYELGYKQALEYHAFVVRYKD